jgi:hypothetical protein
MVAKATIQRFVERATRLYEQERQEPKSLSAPVFGACGHVRSTLR